MHGAPPRAGEHRLHFLGPVNRLSERTAGRGTLAPVDPERHALEARIEHAKSRIVEDLNRASGLLRDAAARTGRGASRIALFAGLCVAGVLLFFAVRARPRRIRITWK